MQKFSYFAAKAAPAGLLLIATGTLMPLLAGGFGKMPVATWLYTAGAVWLLVCRLFSPYRGSDMRLKRWHRIESWSAIIFCVGAVFMWYPGASPQDWLAFTLAGAAIQAIASIATTVRRRA